MFGILGGCGISYRFIPATVSAESSSFQQLYLARFSRIAANIFLYGDTTLIKTLQSNLSSLKMKENNHGRTKSPGVTCCRRPAEHRDDMG